MQKRIEFSADSLLRLCTHYLQDSKLGVPLDAELISAGVSPFLQRYVMLEVRSHEWNTKNTPIDLRTGEPELLHVRYEGHRTASWQQDGRVEPEANKFDWQYSVDNPYGDGSAQH